MFEQKGLFQADASIHLALCQTALQNYHSFTQRLQQGCLRTQPDESDSDTQLGHSEASGSKWGFEHMPERVSAAQEPYTYGMAKEADGPTVRLPNLQVNFPPTIHPCFSLGLSTCKASISWQSSNNRQKQPVLPCYAFKLSSHPDMHAGCLRQEDILH